jgi:hypothetical protein
VRVVFYSFLVVGVAVVLATTDWREYRMLRKAEMAMNAEMPLRGDLLKLVKAEASFFSDSLRYSGDAIALRFAGSSGVSAPQIRVFPHGWFAISRVDRRFCIVQVNAPEYVYAFPGHRFSSLNDGEPACAEDEAVPPFPP